MSKRRKKPAEKLRSELREDALRPNPYLGYGRDALGMHLISCGAYEIAEPQLRRAVWLNPFEPIFKQHLAWCLFKQKRYVDAKHWIVGALKQAPGQPKNQELLELIENVLNDGCRVDAQSARNERTRGEQPA